MWCQIISSSSFTVADLTGFTAAAAAILPPPFERNSGSWSQGLNAAGLEVLGEVLLLQDPPRTPRYLNHPNGIPMRSRIQFCRFEYYMDIFFTPPSRPPSPRTCSASPSGGHGTPPHISGTQCTKWRYLVVIQNYDINLKFDSKYSLLCAILVYIAEIY